MRTRKSFFLAALIVLGLGPGVFSFLFLSLWAKTAPDIPKDFTPSSSISVTVVVVTDKSLLPDAFSLSQNYPNPFNSETLIEYALPANCYVEMTIYNILGQKVKTLVNEYQNAGYKMVRWNGKDDQGNDIASGVYFYKIEAGRYVYVKKMMVLK